MKSAELELVRVGGDVMTASGGTDLYQKYNMLYFKDDGTPMGQAHGRDVVDDLYLYNSESGSLHDYTTFDAINADIGYLPVVGMDNVKLVSDLVNLLKTEGKYNNGTEYRLHWNFLSDTNSYEFNTISRTSTQ